ncbi:glycosyltransferase family 4 protein [Candidatus Peregrinibacteria bacterium]|nr:glycosyltransferase family 4 protein [Candidatus Peregrinibacteria bacterium]
MKIAIDIRTASGEKTGKGWFTFHIVRNLLGLDRKNKYILYAKNKVPGFDDFKNVEQKIIKRGGIFWHFAAARDAGKEKVDIFLAPTSYIIPVILPQSIKKIIFVHDLVAFLFPNTHNKKAVFIERMLLKKAIQKSDAVVTISKHTKKDLMHQFDVKESKIHIIPCSAGDEFMPLGKEELEVFAKKTTLPKKFFLAVGTIEPRKNYLNLIKAFEIVNKGFPDYHLMIVGQNGWGYEPVYEEIRKKYLNKKVHVLGYLSGKSLICLYNLAQALVFPSYYEGFGIPPLEAMKCGCPVIASHTSSIPEVVGDSALLIGPKDFSAIASAMIKVIKDKELCAKLREHGFMQAGKFSWDYSAQKLLDIIEEA